MKTDNEIKQDVEHELQWDPEIDATDIAVATKDGVVELAGFVHSYQQKWQAERDTKRLGGVKGIANDIEVRIPAVDETPDPELARHAVNGIENELPYDHKLIKVIAKHAWITLEGELEWNYQKQKAENAVRRVKGIKGVSNLITLRPRIEATEVKRKIQAAFKRSAEIDANRIQVEAKGREVVLKGSVRSWAERQEAERVAWQAPGVLKVDNRVSIE